MKTKTSSGVILTDLETFCFKEAAEATIKIAQKFSDIAGDSVAVFITFQVSDERAQSLSFKDLSGIHIRNVIERPKIISFPYIYRCGDYFGEPEDIVALSDLMTGENKEDLLEIKGALASLWDAAAKGVTSIDLSRHLVYCVTDVIGYTSSGICELDMEDVQGVKCLYSYIKDYIFKTSLQKILKKHLNAAERGQTPYYTLT